MGMCHRTAGCRGFGSYSKGGDRIREIGKLLSDFSSIALLRGRPEKGSAAPVIRLNSTSLSPNSFLLSLTSASISEHAHPFVALLDLGSSHCFVDKLFAKKNKLSLSKLLSTIPLQLFDGTTQNSVSHKTTILLTFSTGETHWTEFYVTKLDKGYSIVLSYDWLVHHNPSIDWAETKVVFPGTMKAPERPSIPASSKFDIQMVSAKTISHLCHEPSNSIYCLDHHSNVEVNKAFPHSTSPHSEPTSELHSVRTSTLALDSMAGIPVDYHEFHKVFSGTKANTLPPHQPYDLQISLEEGVKPFHGPIYSLSPPELTALREFLEEHTRNGFIRPTKSLWGALVLFVKKKDGSLRLCVDFHALNKVMEKDRYPLLLITDLLNAPGPARIYLKIDLKHAYHLVCIVEGDEPKTAFRTRYGSFEWRVMPFGLSNAPAVFQRFINDVLEGLLDVCTIGYIDDILVYSDSLEEHKDHVWEVLRQLRDAGLYANPKKCTFHTNTVEYLGFILSPEGLRMDPAKVLTIQAWLVPCNVREVQSFLGFANFYQHFISSYMEFTQPLTNLCQKNTPWHFGEPESTAFQHLKMAFRTAPVLYHWAPDLPMTVETDASDYAIVGILSITTLDLEICPIAFHSQSPHDAARNYDTHNKELLAVFDCYKAWHHYLEGSGNLTDTVTDHKNLEYFTSMKKLTH